MAQHLDLEEQEQLDQIKHFWKQYGNLISWVLIAVFGSLAAHNGWQYWQRSQAAKAAVLFEEVERAAQARDLARTERSFGDIRDKFGGTTYALQAGLLAARVLADGGKADGARAALVWVSESSDPGLRSLAQLRLAGLLLDAGQHDEALARLAQPLAPEFAALASDRRGDILLAQGKKTEARAQYESAYKAFGARDDYRRVVEIKLNALGVDPRAAAVTESKP